MQQLNACILGGSIHRNLLRLCSVFLSCLPLPAALRRLVNSSQLLVSRNVRRTPRPIYCPRPCYHGLQCMKPDRLGAPLESIPPAEGRLLATIYRAVKENTTTQIFIIDTTPFFTKLSPVSSLSPFSSSYPPLCQPSHHFSARSIRCHFSARSIPCHCRYDQSGTLFYII